MIKEVRANETTQSGIILPEASKEATNIAEIVAIGSGTKDDPMQLSVGERVIIAKFSGTQIEFEGETLIVMEQNQVLAIVAD